MARPRKRSKKPSAASSNERPRKTAVFYLDESIYSHRLADALESAGVSVRRPGVDVPVGARDTEWLRRVGEQGWIALLRDQKVRYRQPETVAIFTARVGAFVFTGGQVTAAETAEILVKRLRKILNIAASERRPFLYTITAGGQIRRFRLKKPAGR